MINIQPLNELSIYLNHLVKKRLWLQVLIAMFLGIGLGLLLNPEIGFVQQETSEKMSSWLNLPGQIFLKLVQMVMIPLIFASIISGLVSNVSDNLKEFGLKLLFYFLLTTTVAISIGISIAYLFKPGSFVQIAGGLQSSSHEAEASPETTQINIPESISNLIPANPLESLVSGEMLSIVIFTIIIGVAITQLEYKIANPIIRIVEAIQKICMIVVGWAMRIVPYAVFGLMAALLATTGMTVFYGLAYYIGVVLFGLLILLLFYALIYVLIINKSPFQFFKNIKDAQLLAFSTASSAAVMPLSMKVADEKLGVSSRISDFIIPIGATINMDGTALFQCVTVLFLAQSYGIEIEFVSMLFITATIVAASIGTPAIPGGGVIILASVLQSSGIPADGLLIIIGIDRILGMFRTAVNVTGDLTATVVFNKWFSPKTI